MEIADWLRGLGLEQYAQTFRDNAIDSGVLPALTEAHLKELGLPLGHRLKLLQAIAVLDDIAPLPSEPAPAPQTPGSAERRQVTVMFCDLVGSTALSGRLDPEELREVIGRYHACVAETVRRFDGFVAKYMGDGVLVYFGYPHAHEDDAEQAVRASLALVAAVGELAAPQPLKVRIGVATGLVVVGDLIGAGSAQEQAIVGETPNLAAQLQALAEPNAIMIAGSTHRQIGTLFEIVDFGPQPLKGFAEPQHAWRVSSESRGLGRFEALRSGETPLIGRDEEMDLLLRRWGQAKAGEGRVVLISADPGIGKSRLTEALAERIAGEPHIRSRYFCSPHHQDSALYPVIAQMERAACFTRENSPGEKLAKLQVLLATATPPMEDVALTAELLSLPGAGLPQPLDMTLQRKKEKTLEALLRQLKRLSQRQPVLMVFEDIHWIDPSSRELLDRTIERLRAWPVLLLATFRPEFQPPWIGHPHVTMLALPRLDQRAAATLVANIAGNAELPSEIVQEIAERTDGVPLFVEELTRAVIEAGTHSSAALSSAPRPALSVPATLQASLMARLDRLGPAAKDVAQRGAIIGREFSHELLALIADQPEPQLSEALYKLASSGLLFARGTPPQSTYMFKHALVQDAAYGTLLRTRRQQLHSRIGGVLEAQFPETSKSQPELLAHHFTEAGLAERAIQYWIRAGQQALARSGMAEAEALLRKGLNLLLSLPDSAWRQEHELDLQIALGQAFFATHGYGAPAAGATYTRARQLCDKLDCPHRLLPILWGQWAHHLNAGDLERAQEFAAEMRQLGEARDNVIMQVAGCRASGCTSFWLGDIAPARAYLERGLSLYDPAQRPLYAGLPHDMLVLLLGNLSTTLVFCGYLDQARSRCEATLAEARRLSHAHTLANALTWALATRWCALSEPWALLQYADELLTLSDEKGFDYWRMVALSFRGWCLTALGRADEGISLLAASLAEYGATGSSLSTATGLTTMADAYRVAGQPQVALEHLARAERFAYSTQIKLILPDTLRLRGDLLIVTGDRVAAEASFRNAIALARQQEAKLFELRAAASLAGLWRIQGKFADARELLAPVYAWFTEGFDAPDLIDARALLGELGEPAGCGTVAEAAAVPRRTSG